MQAQPASVAEETGVGELARREVQRQLIAVHLQVPTEVGEVLRHDHGLTVRQDRDAHVTAGDDLER